MPQPRAGSETQVFYLPVIRDENVREDDLHEGILCTGDSAMKSWWCCTDPTIKHDGWIRPTPPGLHRPIAREQDPLRGEHPHEHHAREQ